MARLASENEANLFIFDGGAIKLQNNSIISIYHYSSFSFKSFNIFGLLKTHYG
jgi:hypothetical protein